MEIETNLQLMGTIQIDFPFVADTRSAEVEAREQRYAFLRIAARLAHALHTPRTMPGTPRFT
jgi:hypothetical protein